LAQAVVGDQPPAENDKTAMPIAMPSRDAHTLKALREATYEKVEKAYLIDLMEKTGGDILTACKISGISRARLYQLIKKHGITIPG
jgi:transcriptional regulator of acetoin/glycerol metabolism